MEKIRWIDRISNDNVLDRACVERGWIVEGCAGRKNGGKEEDRQTKRGNDK